MVKVVTFGETMVLYNADYTGPYIDGMGYSTYSAGAESNFLVCLNKLGLEDVYTVWVSRLGNDEGADLILSDLRGKTHFSAPKYSGEKTGICYLHHLDDGTHVKTYDRKGSAASKLEYQDVLPYLEGCDLIHVTGITPALSDSCRDTVLEVLNHAGQFDILISFDVNFRNQLWEPCLAKPFFERVIRASKVLKIGHDEAEIVWGKRWTAIEYARYFQDLNDGIVIITVGSGGAVAFDGYSVKSQPGYTVNVVEPVGAGDAFMAGFLGSIFRDIQFRDFFNLEPQRRSHIINDALRIANVCGAFTCTKKGDTEGMPSMKEVEEYLDRMQVIEGK